MFLSMADAISEIMLYLKRSFGPITGANGGCDILTAAAEFGVQLASTILLFIIVRVFFWKPITNILEKRREAMDHDLEAAKEAKETAVETQKKLEAELGEAKSKIREMLEAAEKEANIKRDEILAKAKEDAEKRMENLEFELANEKKSMEAEIRKEIVDVAFAAAEKIVAREINQDKYLDVVDEILKGAME